MNRNKFSMEPPKVKPRRHLPPPGNAHKDRRNDYDRKAFKKAGAAAAAEFKACGKDGGPDLGI